MAWVYDRIMKLARQLYPTGRVWKMPFEGFFDALNQGLALSEERAYNDARAILNSILPDTDKFTVEDARDWERRLGLITNELVSLDDRKLAIQLKLNFPGRTKARQSATWLQRQLQAAGFNVFVYENLTGQTPFEVSGDSSILNYIQYGDVQYGDQMYGKYYSNKVVNYIDEAKDKLFNEGGSFRASFFIGGNTLGSFANVDVNRKDEFRQLILKTKPGQLVGFLFINYI